MLYAVSWICSVALAQTGWQTEAPQKQGFSQAKLEAMRAKLAAKGTAAVVIVRQGKLVYEWYSDKMGPDRKHYSASLAKAVVGGTTLMLSMDDGRIAPNHPASRYIPEWKEHPQKSRITIRHLATHSSGIEDAEQDGIGHMELPGWKGEFWRRKPNPFQSAIQDAPVLFEPGSRYAYSNPGMAALAYAVTASLENSDLQRLLKGRVMDPLGIAESEWSIGYGQAFERNGMRLFANWGGGNFTPRAVARIGQWMVQQGQWNGNSLVSPAVLARMTEYARTPKPDRTRDAYAPASGLCWYTNSDGVWKGVPKDAFAGAGAGHQLLLVVPSLKLVAVRNGAAMGSKPYWTAAYEEFFEPLLEALEDKDIRAPYPQSELVTGVEFAPVSTIARGAEGSDNWPWTWMDDGNLLFAYGDGSGFAPGVEKKLSLGLSVVRGGPTNFRAVNLRSETGEKTGEGARGLKTSGMLMVDGVVYMWVRNAANSQLAWSEDRGKTWQWGWRFTESFASPAPLNFGRNHEGARDNYVYLYSQDGNTAYAASDRVVLARVPRERIRDRDAYEFLERLEERKAIWTRDLNRRGAVFSFPGHCERVEAVWHPRLRRYLLLVGYNHRSGWGIYEAPEPWGPWSTVFHTNEWDLPRTHGYRLPSKWFEGDSAYLVFSGATGPGVHYDAFCVRRMRFRLR